MRVLAWSGPVLLAVASVASAHARLKQSTPAEGAVVSTAPAQIVLTFSEPALVTSLSIQHDANQPEKLGPVPKDAEVTVTVPTPGLKPGKYVLTWRAVSDDKHITSGQVHFTIS
jgi:methionine-rich copper-binding protein CopC